MNRYHILARHYVALVDHFMRLAKHPHAPNDLVKEMGATDQLIAGMAIWLSRLLGSDRFCLVTADYRLAKVLQRGHTVTEQEAIDWGLREVEDRTGIPWSVELYPKVIDLQRDDDVLLRELLGQWPLPEGQRRTNRSKVSREQRAMLLKLFSELNLQGRDRLPYSKHMTQLRSSFRAATGLSLPEAEIWRLLLTSLKKGMKNIVIDTPEGSDGESPLFRASDGEEPAQPTN